jgi:uncharacterized protein YkuJ
LKEGNCPIKVTTKKGNKKAESKCDADSECVGVQKCCQQETGAFDCVDPAAKAKGPCPADRVGRPFKSDVTCSSDDGCPGNTQCCARAGAQVCRSPDLLKEGSCPIKVTTKKGNKKAESKCDADSECFGVQKCCQHETGAFDCVDPAK